MKVRLLLAVAALAFVSCKKEKSQEDPFKGQTCDYAPYSDGATFSYNMVDGTSDTLRFSLKATGDSTLNGEVWRVLEDMDDGTKGLFRCGNGMYEQFADFSGIPGAPADPVRSVYLRENVNLGGSWTEMMLIDIPMAGSVNATITHTIMQKGTAKEVAGQRFESVIGVRTEVSVPPLVPAQTVLTSFYAKGVGLIEADTETDTTYIVSYNIP
ncbi:hypothetical protein [Chitinophaga sp.]|uniref:hypothetical protein n=1 Tax=Chitinophaga sp. TaxID=1869181 RepID=UPI0026221110|nr:hypothetical protein [uncultured Chitinophaga sp.]